MTKTDTNKAPITSGDTVTLPRSVLNDAIAALHGAQQFGVAGALNDAIIAPQAVRITSGDAVTLDACPFCSGAAQATYEDEPEVCWVGCTVCGVSTDTSPEMAEVVAAWNQRATEQVQVPSGDVTDEQAWQLAVTLFGTIQNFRSEPHVQIHNAAEAGEFARALLAQRAGAADKPIYQYQHQWSANNVWCDTRKDFYDRCEDIGHKTRIVYAAPVSATADAAPAGAVAGGSVASDNAVREAALEEAIEAADSALLDIEQKIIDGTVSQPIRERREAIENAIRALKSAATEVPPAPSAGTGDAIAKSKRILSLVDTYVEAQTRDNRTALRCALWDEFQAAPSQKASSVPDDWIGVETSMPVDHQDVIILYWPYDNRENAQVAGTARHIDGVFYDEDGNDMHYPSHWMPFVLPAAPVPADASSEGGAA